MVMRILLFLVIDSNAFWQKKQEQLINMSFVHLEPKISPLNKQSKLNDYLNKRISKTLSREGIRSQDKNIPSITKYIKKGK